MVFKQKSYKRKNLQNGFTLIEMVIVATIIGILSGVVISLVNPQKFNNRARDSVRANHITKIAEAAEAYANLEDTYPLDRATLEASPYMSSWPDGSPSTDDVYTYSYDSVNNIFSIYTENSDGEYLKYFSTEGRVMVCTNPGDVATSCDGLGS